MNQVVIIREAVTGTLLAYLPMKAANSRFIDVSDLSKLDHTSCKTKNHCRSIDDHCQHGTWSVMLSVLPMKAANSMIVHNND